MSEKGKIENLNKFDHKGNVPNFCLKSSTISRSANSFHETIGNITTIIERPTYLTTLMLGHKIANSVFFNF